MEEEGAQVKCCAGEEARQPREREREEEFVANYGLQATFATTRLRDRVPVSSWVRVPFVWASCCDVPLP